MKGQGGEEGKETVNLKRHTHTRSPIQYGIVTRYLCMGVILIIYVGCVKVHQRDQK